MSAMNVGRAAKTCAALAAAVAALLSVSSAGASASQTVGNECVANESRPNATAIGLYSNTQPTPQSNVYPGGVITRWIVHAPAEEAPITQRLIVNRQVGEEDDSKVGESALETIVPGTNEFATRVPAPDYAHIGLTGPDGALFCDHSTGSTAGLVEGAWPIGETRHFGVEVNVSVPVVAIVEPDRDHDGYGDETQDGCPQGASYQSACPIVHLEAVARAKPGAIFVDVTPTAEAKISAWGKVGQGGAPKGGKSPRRPAIALRATKYKWVAGGVATRIKLPFPKALVRRLNRTAPQETLRAKVFVHSIDLAGRPSTETLAVELRGRSGS
jgi:hypothetical protein